MLPQVQTVFLNWMESTQMKIIKPVVSDFEVQEDIQAIITFEAVVQPMKAREVQRKPENERTWRWFDMWSTTKVQIDTVIQSAEGIEYRVQGITDWSAGGFFKYDLTEQPVGL